MKHGKSEWVASSRPIAASPLSLIATLPAALVIAASPILAAGPSQHLVSLCAVDGVHWAFVPGEPLPGEIPADDCRHSMCAHATCPRESAVTRKRQRVL